MAWGKLTSKTLTGASDTITTDVFTAKKFNHINMFIFNTAGDIRVSGRLGTTTIDSGSNYAYRRNSNGAAEETFTSTDRFSASSGAVSDNEYWVVNICNIISQEKLVISHAVRSNTSGAANAPTRHEMVGKWITSTQADIFGVFNDQAGDFATDSNIMIMGTD